jgi:hypothetical protein
LEKQQSRELNYKETDLLGLSTTSPITFKSEIPTKNNNPKLKSVVSTNNDINPNLIDKTQIPLNLAKKSFIEDLFGNKPISISTIETSKTNFNTPLTTSIHKESITGYINKFKLIFILGNK